MLFAQEEYRFKCLPVNQPLGTFFVASVPYQFLIDISYADVRRLEKEREVETYLGIQRPLQRKRVAELQEYVNTFDACFPTAIIVAIDSRCATLDGDELVLHGYTGDDGEVTVENIAKIIDGQHRIAGLEGFRGDDFDVPVSIFIDIDIADQAYLFSTVNLAQTKVQKSLAYDLFSLAKARSPQKTCHNIAVSMDMLEKSPLYGRIKRLGVSTIGRTSERISQATFVESLLEYISTNPIQDRDRCLRSKALDRSSNPALVFRDFFVQDEDFKIADVVWNFFAAVANRWPVAWNSEEQGMVLSKTNGFKGLMKSLGPIYQRNFAQGSVPSSQEFLEILSRVSLEDHDFNVENFKPGSSGSGAIARRLLDDVEKLS
ncbi:DGQHR domain-containing protein [Nitrogeniibacter aestuarii]|uniref:DGQHR domain-containing protein n=1 Tax=Nitrogeniibacter aestuarii TaxID=2815343 RepID=UPI001D12ACA1|nr:DGQHR domain-containing protein [Nitrogeniibacter aestuarii]